jgi:ATP-binding cassette subfamily B protein
MSRDGKSPRPLLDSWRRLRGTFAHTGPTLALVWRSSPRLTLALVLLTVVAAGLYPWSAIVGKLIIHAVVAAQAARGAARGAALRQVLACVLLELATIAAIALSERVQSLLKVLLGSRLGVDVNVAILEKAASLELRHFEDPEFCDKLVRARREASSRPLAALQENLTILKNILQLLGYTALLIRFSSWMMGAVVVASASGLIAETRFSMHIFRQRNARSPELRRLNYLEHVLADHDHAKEVKLFGLAPLLLGRYRELAERFHDEDRRLALRRVGWAYALSLMGTLTFYGCYGLIAMSTVRGRLSLGEMTLYLVAFRQAQQASTGLLTALSGMYEHNLYMSNLFEYLAIPGTEAKRPRLAPSPVRREEGVRFEDVGFRYPGTPEWALREVSLYIPPGQSLALVGENGAGKTTLIKLLTRLYPPTDGRILLDGRDLGDWKEEPLRRRIGVIFQDFNHYQFLLRENVALGSVEHREDELRVHRAVDQGGARALVASLRAGLDTQLGRRFKDGIELSGGQWQKVALARAFMREEADILILDEPTAALDAEAEHVIFERFRTLARGRTTILISHRFPTARMSDRILVLEHGRIVEDGNHATLLQGPTRYARLYDLHARRFRDGDSS